MATLVTTLGVILLMVNHKGINAAVAQIQRNAGGPGNVGVNLPGSVVFLVKLDHFFVDYFYVLIPFAWLVTFLAWAVIRGVYGLLQPKKKSEMGPFDLATEQPFDGR
jgi:hypothetical protein